MSVGFGMELILRRLGYSCFRPSVVDAAVLDHNVKKARLEAKKPVLKKMDSPELLKKRLMNTEADKIYAGIDIVNLNVENDAEFEKLVLAGVNVGLSSLGEGSLLKKKFFFAQSSSRVAVITEIPT